MRGLMGRALWSMGGVLVVFALLFGWAIFSLHIAGTLPPPTGSYAIGRMEFDWTDQSRPDPFIFGKQNRELDVFVWYPADRPGTKQAIYLRDNWRDNLAVSFPWPTYEGVRTYSWEDASALRGTGAPWPVVILSPGRGEVPIEYTALAEQLASEGYIVASPTNTRTGPTVVFPDGRIVKSDEDEPEVEKLLSVCVDDIRTVLKHLTVLNEDSRSPFFQKIDFERSGIIGHSWGGAVSAEFCSVDDRCTAGVDLDGGLYGGAAQKGIGKPFLFLVSEGTPPYWLRARMLFRPSLKARWAEVREEENTRWRTACGVSLECQIEVLPGVRHLNFGDLGVLFRRPLYWLHPMLGRVGGQQGVRITREKVSEFLHRSLRDRK